MILNCSDISKSYDGVDILSHCSFHINDREKVAVIGSNGAGKSTLFKIILGEITPDSGTVSFSKNATVGYLAQHANVDGDNTIYDELLSVHKNLVDMEATLAAYEARMQLLEGSELENLIHKYTDLSHEFERLDGYVYKTRLVGVLKGLGFSEEDFSRSISTLSGGQKTRVALGKLLVTQPDVIFLDEPTNHLDMDSIKWLETYLLNYSGSVCIISHDRYFLDKIVTRVVEVEDTRLLSFEGNYTAFAAKKAILRNMQMKEYLNQQREIKHQEEVITKLKQFNREKSIKRAESREKMLEKIQLVDKPSEYQEKMHLSLEPEVVSGNDVLMTDNLSKSYSHKLFDGVTFNIYRGDKVALIGKNGTGKTTLLKILTGLIEADSGSFRLGTNVSIGYYDQEHLILNDKNTLFDEISDAYPDMNNTRIRNTLAAFLFTGDDVFKQVGDLSGGEKGRLSLAKLMLSKANFLILDEPTNHLDVDSAEILESAINNYSGTVLYVSHDRYFINKTATRILDLTASQVVNYDGNYDYYLDKVDILSPVVNTVQTGDTAPSNSKEKWKESKEEQARLKKIKNQIASTEKRIEELENRLAQLNEDIADPAIATNSARLMELHTAQEQVNNELNSLYQTWEDLSLEL